MGETFAEPQGGGSLILAWQVKNKKVLVVGGGEVIYTITGETGHGVNINTQLRSPQAAYSTSSTPTRESP